MAFLKFQEHFKRIHKGKMLTDTRRQDLYIFINIDTLAITNERKLFLGVNYYCYNYSKYK